MGLDYRVAFLSSISTAVIDNLLIRNAPTSKLPTLIVSFSYALPQKKQKQDGGVRRYQERDWTRHLHNQKSNINTLIRSAYKIQELIFMEWEKIGV